MKSNQGDVLDLGWIFVYHVQHLAFDSQHDKTHLINHHATEESLSAYRAFN